jgi:hypothetical protein
MLHLRLACTAHQQAVLTSAQKTLTEVGQCKLAACTGAQNGGAGVRQRFNAEDATQQAFACCWPGLSEETCGRCNSSRRAATGCYALQTETFQQISVTSTIEHVVVTCKPLRALRKVKANVNSRARREF